jgi:hypothetical protein
VFSWREMFGDKRDEGLMRDGLCRRDGETMGLNQRVLCVSEFER